MKIHSIVYRSPPPGDKPGCSGKLILRSGNANPPAVPASAGNPETKPAPEFASLKTKVGRLRVELTKWIKAGAKVVPREVRKERLEFCEACEYYDPKGNFGLGQCGAPGCSCSRLKLALATSKCPYPGAPKWGVWVPPQGG